ncbi:hypothetical protein DL98DRAFT_576022 [Cadophora sp. DSE1049]|nr:hypothetical protein DL98DRAFT_576022 [Cadophora sp. DSE1049]
MVSTDTAVAVTFGLLSSLLSLVAVLIGFLTLRVMYGQHPSADRLPQTPKHKARPSCRTTDQKCALTRAISSCSCTEYLHQGDCLNFTSLGQNKCHWTPNNQTKRIEGRCSKHDRNVQKEALRLAQLEDIYGVPSAAPLFLGKKLDKLIQVCEANTAEMKNVVAQGQANAAKVDVNTTDVQTSADKFLNAVQPPKTSVNTGIPDASANDIPLKKALAAAKLYAVPIATGVNKLQSEVEKKKDAIRIFFKNSLADPEISTACRERLERLLEIGWDHFERHVEDAFKRAEDTMVKAAEEGVLTMMASMT